MLQCFHSNSSKQKLSLDALFRVSYLLPGSEHNQRVPVPRPDQSLGDRHILLFH